MFEPTANALNDARTLGRQVTHLLRLYQGRDFSNVSLDIATEAYDKVNQCWQSIEQELPNWLDLTEDHDLQNIVTDISDQQYEIMAIRLALNGRIGTLQGRLPTPPPAPAVVINSASDPSPWPT